MQAKLGESLEFSNKSWLVYKLILATVYSKCYLLLHYLKKKEKKKEEIVLDVKMFMFQQQPLNGPSVLLTLYTNLYYMQNHMYANVIHITSNVISFACTT